MKLKRAILSYRREVTKIPKKELLKNLENAFENYVNVEKTYQAKFDKGLLDARELSPYEVRTKFAVISNLLKRGGRLSGDTAIALRVFLRKMRKIIPTMAGKKGVKQLSRYTSNLTNKLVEDYISMANNFDSRSEEIIMNYIKSHHLTEEELQGFFRSHKNIDLTYVAYDSLGLNDFDSDYNLSVPVARFLEYFGEDYTTYNM